MLIRLASILTFVFFAGNCLAQDPEGLSSEDAEAFVIKLRDMVERPQWTYSQLKSESDLIVVVKLVSKSTTGAAGETPSANAVTYESNIVRVLTVLKGEPQEMIDVVLAQRKPGIVDLSRNEYASLVRELPLPHMHVTKIDGKIVGYGLLETEDGKPRLEVIEPEYLLFLRKKADGKFEPVTGQQYSAMSVKLLNN